MCGIAGIISKKGWHHGEQELRRITDLVAHRGPDGHAYFFDKQIALGHRRLAIIDLSHAADQPMNSSDLSLTIVFNGEIFNYIELRNELRTLGRVFRSESDTEVILEAYAVWGDRCVERFNGFWAFAIYDHRSNTVFCSRDRFGLKPFHYVETDEVFAFGSEIKQLLGFLPQCVADYEGLTTFLLTGLTDYSEQTLFAGVKRLLGGHNLVLDIASGRFTIRRFYELRPGDSNGATEGEVRARFLELFRDSVRLRLRSDVQVATCLSGGLDSSAVATVAAELFEQQTRQRFAAVTAESVDAENDETEYARKVVESAHLQWCRVRPSSSDMISDLDALVYHQEEPFPSLSMMMQFSVMRALRAHGIPVVLDGQGADETLLGYGWHFVPQVRSKWRLEGSSSALRALMISGRNNGTSTAFRAKTLAKFFAPKTANRWLQRSRACGMRVENLPRVMQEWSAASTDLREFQAHEISTSVLPALLRFEDRNSMAFSVEGRLPFLDYRLVEFCLGLPSDYKIRDGWSKWILRATMNDRLPHEVVWRKKKIGFEAPKSVLRDGLLVNSGRAVQRSELLSKLIKIEQVQRLSTQDPATAWKFHSVALWAERFNCADLN